MCMNNNVILKEKRLFFTLQSHYIDMAWLVVFGSVFVKKEK
jgi:hypothetical protein